jgi:GAF domain-containing protein
MIELPPLGRAGIRPGREGVVGVVKQDEQVAKVFAGLALELHQEPGVEETIDAVLQFALLAVGCTHAGVVLVRRGGRLDPAASTAPVVRQIDQLQLEYGEGPTLTSVADRNDVGLLVKDLALDERWPVWGPEAAALGLRSALALRLHTGGATLGVLELFHPEPDAFGADEDAVAHILARHASVAVATARQEASLWQAVDARKLIGQAQGMLMERFAMDEDQAFAVLRRYSQDYNIKLRDVADRLICTRKLPDRPVRSGDEPVA